MGEHLLNQSHSIQFTSIQPPIFSLKPINGACATLRPKEQLQFQLHNPTMGRDVPICLSQEAYLTAASPAAFPRLLRRPPGAGASGFVHSHGSCWSFILSARLLWRLSSSSGLPPPPSMGSALFYPFARNSENPC
uniref:Uncharacterized protein n=1 Tax=Opuntia streptacantha TaxID=393608 RepID=A0A7C9ASA3_OPUST